MPTFTTIALENLLEYRNPTKNSSTIKNHPQPSTKYLQNHGEQNDEAAEESKSKATKRLNHIYISPALYTTPEPTPILDYSSSGSLSPSPYVFNRKGRGGGKSVNRRIDGFEVEESGKISGGNGGEGLQGGEEELVDCILLGEGVERENRLVVEGEGEEDAGDDDFVDPRCDSFSVDSSSELNDSGRLGLESMSVVSNQIGEFYDATEDFSSDVSMSVASCSRNIESELHATRLSLLDEMEKRKTAEDELAMMCSQWQRVGKLLLSQTGLTFLSTANNGSPKGFDINAMKQFSQEVIVARFVAEAMGKAEAQVEAEAAAEVIIGSKDKEISRLRDRLQYYEAMIHEMSQKNLETMEVARRQRERKKSQRKWLWSCIGISVVVGASVIAYSYAPTPQGSEHQPLDATLPEGGYD